MDVFKVFKIAFNAVVSLESIDSEGRHVWIPRIPRPLNLCKKLRVLSAKKKVYNFSDILKGVYNPHRVKRHSVNSHVF